MSFYISIVCTRSFQKSLDMLLPTIPSHFNKIIIYQEEDQNHIHIENETTIFVTISKSMFEYAHWIALKALLDNGIVSQDSIFLLLHSTCKFIHDPTPKIIKAIIDFRGYDIYFLCKSGACNICIINRKGIDMGFLFYKEYDIMSKDDACNFEFNQNRKECPKSWGGVLNIKFYNEPHKITGDGYIYSNDRLRQINSFDSIDLEKYSAVHSNDNPYTM